MGGEAVTLADPIWDTWDTSPPIDRMEVFYARPRPRETESDSNIDNTKAHITHTADKGPSVPNGTGRRP